MIEFISSNSIDSFDQFHPSNKIRPNSSESDSYQFIPCVVWPTISFNRWFHTIDDSMQSVIPSIRWFHAIDSSNRQYCSPSIHPIDVCSPSFPWLKIRPSQFLPIDSISRYFQIPSSPSEFHPSKDFYPTNCDQFHCNWFHSIESSNSQYDWFLTIESIQ